MKKIAAAVGLMACMLMLVTEIGFTDPPTWRLVGARVEISSQVLVGYIFVDDIDRESPPVVDFEQKDLKKALLKTGRSSVMFCPNVIQAKYPPDTFVSASETLDLSLDKVTSITKSPGPFDNERNYGGIITVPARAAELMQAKKPYYTCAPPTEFGGLE